MHRFLIFFICLIVVSHGYAYSASCKEHHCIAIIDAGSTGSRMHVYAYDIDKNKSPVNINELWSKKTKPGFASLDPNQNTIDSYLTTLLSDSPEQNLPVYFYASAGMRLLPPTKQKMYYSALQNWFIKQSQWQLIEAKTIKGNEEALFAWLAVNYHLGFLQSSEDKAVGVMDMGGASVQIVFPLHKKQAASTNSQVDLDLYGRHITLFVHSFLGLGQTEMSHQFLNSAACFTNDYPLPDGDSGQGSSLSCEQDVSSLINGVHGVNNLVQPLLADNPVDSWFAIGGIANLAHSKLFHFENKQLTNQNLLEQANSEICQQQWDNLNRQFPDDEYVYEYCLFSSYYYALMVDGYGLLPEQKINYIAPDQNLDWTLGVVLHH